MPLLAPIRREGREFHVQLGRHDVVPTKNDSLDAKHLDALVIEEFSMNSPQNSLIIAAMRKQGKPIYLVENSDLANLAQHLTGQNRKSLVASVIFGGLSVGGLQAFLADLKRNPNTTRRGFFSKVKDWVSAGAGGGIAGAGLGYGAINTDFGRMLPQLNNRPTETRLLTKKEIDALPRDVKSGLVLAARNAVVAEGMIRLSEKHKRIGVSLGGLHYNLGDYLRNDELRHTARGKYEPEIVEYK